MSTLSSIFQLVRDCIEQTAASSARFSGVVLMGLLVAALAHMACFFSVRLWNRQFHMKLRHHLICGVAGLATLFFVITYFSLSHVSNVVNEKTAGWLKSLENEKFSLSVSWSMYRAFLEKWPEAQEKVVGNRPPGAKVLGRRYAEAASLGAAVITKLAIDDFNTNFSILSKIIGASQRKVEKQAADAMFPGIKSSLESGVGYPYSKGCRLVADSIQDELILRIPRVVTLSRMALVSAFLLIQAVAFGLVAWLGYLDIHQKTSGGFRR